MKLLKRIFQRKPKPILLDNTYRIVPAFEWKGTTYYMHEDPMNAATGRGLTAMMFMEEILMRCSVDYLKSHVDACEAIFSDPRKINLPMLMKLNNNMKERISLLVALPEQVFKMASVVFFTKEESPYRYDYAFNKTKIKAWSEEPGMYDFFCQGHLKTLMPFLTLPAENSEKYLEVVEKINQLHLKSLHEVLSRSANEPASLKSTG
jgi:hypothetical protein